eukprot:CAMPEP_0196817752 /NCGR_PEP_ID=MMETSP1362-20130617/62551_1 /TAXON_ID=163516 /ORGANISM="Leptocylindrus danicus, Strain CCMP1856" /LENGTH=267 /DNA_ID=CAMNT_0042195585 /DNA_START=156 /DNA_END=959 /DNA_ORIENTATION=+
MYKVGEYVQMNTNGKSNDSIGLLVDTVKGRKSSADAGKTWRVAFNDDVENGKEEKWFHQIYFRRLKCDVDLADGSGKRIRTVVIKSNSAATAAADAAKIKEEDCSVAAEEEAVEEAEQICASTRSISSMSSDNEQQNRADEVAASATIDTDLKMEAQASSVPSKEKTDDDSTDHDVAMSTSEEHVDPPLTPSIGEDQDKSTVKRNPTTSSTAKKTKRKKGGKKNRAAAAAKQPLKVKERVEKVPMKTGVLYIYRYGLHPRVEFVRRI